MFAQQRQGANLLFHQYNQLRSIQRAYSNSALASIAFGQQPMDQLVPQVQSQIPTPVQQQQQQQQLQQQLQQQQMQPQIPTPVQQQQIQQQLQQFQQQMQRSSPINMISMSSPDAWLTGSPIAPNSNVFQPIHHPVSRAMLDMVSYHNRTNSISSNPSPPPLTASYDSPKLTHRYYSRGQTPPENHQQRQRLHSGSSCYESDSDDLFTDDEDEFEVNIKIYF